MNKEKLYDLYHNRGMSQLEIADKMGISQSMISYWMRKFGIDSKNRTWKIAGSRVKYTFDDTRTQRMDKDLAWVLGWVVGDGNIRTEGLEILLSERDIDVLQKVREVFRFGGPIKSGATYLKKTGKWYRRVSLSIRRKNLAKWFIEIGVPPRKSQRETYPSILKGCSETIHRAFIRGLFEADGTITKYSTGQMVFQIVGTKELLTMVQSILIEILGLGKTRLYKQKCSRNHFMLRYVGNKQVPRIMDLLYMDGGYRMNRKYEVYQSLRRTA